MPNFEQERAIITRQLNNRLREIQAAICTDDTPIEGIQASVTGPGHGPAQPPKTGWQPFDVNQRWGGYDQTTWFRMAVTIPDRMAGQRVAAFLRPRGESLAYVDGEPRQGLDNNRDAVVLTDDARPGQRFELLLESVPNVRFDTYHLFEYARFAAVHQDVWDFYWDGRVLLEVWQTQPDNYAPARRLLELLDKTIKMVDLQHVGTEAFHASIARASRALKRGLKPFENSHGMGKLILTGHAHIDSAWLWPIRETQRKCSRTFSTVLELMEEYPDFYFSCSQPAQYEWMKEHYPSIYERIKQRVAEGRWEPCGAMWVEPDSNVTGGESQIRQLLYGNRFFEREFGRRSKIAWVPDCFGFAWSLPQIYKKAQIEAFCTTKISWSQFTEFPYSYFQWEGADGSRVLALMPPLNYNGNPVPKDCIAHWDLFKQKERVDTLPFSIGWGDGGGGPTREMIEHGRRLRNVTGVPQCEFGTMEGAIDRMRKQCRDEELPVYNGELYLELHRGCQTSQSRTKRFNRKSEALLRDTEMLSSLALINGGAYEQETIYAAWRTVLTHHFHDILPGSSIREVYATAEKEYADACDKVEAVRREAMETLAGRIGAAPGPGARIVVFNTLSWVRSESVRVEADLPAGNFHVEDSGGHPVPYQRIGPRELLFEARNVPPLGYASFRIVPGVSPEPVEQPELKVNSQALENEYLRVKLDKQGRLTSVYDKYEEREALEKGKRGNALQLFDDRPCDWDAWDVDFNFDENMWEPGPAQIEVVESGPLRAVVRVTRQTEKSTITQDITLQADSPRLDFVTRVDWWEKRVLMKVAFPVAVRDTRATFEIPFATVERPTHNNTPFDRARFEVPAQRWADLSEGDYGVSLLNDSKYGYDVKGNVLRLSLLRAPTEPDPQADEGEHDFTYSLFPHSGDWRSGSIQQAAELNTPLLALAASPVKQKGSLPPANAFASVDADNVIIETVKKHEDSNAVIVRLYEACGHRGEVNLTFGRPPKSVAECDLMEENDTPVESTGASIRLYVTPYAIRTLKVAF